MRTNKSTRKEEETISARTPLVAVKVTVDKKEKERKKSEINAE